VGWKHCRFYRTRSGMCAIAPWSTLWNIWLFGFMV